MRWIYPAGMAAAIVLAGCGGGGGDTATTETVATENTGIFVDSPVDGLSYTGTLGSQGVTANGGLFTFKEKEVITFRVGNVILGDTEVTTADPIVTPLKLVAYAKGGEVDVNDPAVVSIAQFLLTADEDDNPDNGITIDPQTVEKLAQEPALRLDEEAVDPEVVATYLGVDPQEVYPEAEAVNHLLETENEIENHEYDDDLEKTVDGETTPAPAPTPLPAGEYRLLAWNDLGMHCMDGNDYSVFSILPPYNTLVAQLIRKGEEPQHITSGVTMSFEAVPALDGKLNTQSATKTNFWDYVKQLFGIDLQPNEGFHGVYYDNDPQRQQLTYDAQNHWWSAEGIPVTPINDDGSYNMYPMVKVTARDSAGNLLAETTTVLPVSDEMDCRKCHASTSGYEAARPDAGWANLTDPEKDYKTNILRLHDQEHPTAVADHLASLEAKGWNYDAAGLEATVAGGTPILCASCHKSNALPGTGVDTIKPLTQAIHGKHAQVEDPVTGLRLDDSTNRNACYTCHPGATTQCLRGAMGNAKNADGTDMIQCQSCHGVMSAVGRSDREGWLDEPDCQSCHQEGKRYTEAVTDLYSGTLRAALDHRFATTPDVPAAGKSLYRYSTGHGEMKCSACHGSTHAIYPSARPEDNIQSIQAQGHAGTIGECTACHDTVPKTADKGPHGMHAVGQWWVDEHGDYAEDGGASSCTACHGSDYRGSPLSKTMAARTFDADDYGTKTFAAGHMVSCYDCHNGPDGEDD